MVSAELAVYTCRVGAADVDTVQLGRPGTGNLWCGPNKLGGCNNMDRMGIGSVGTGAVGLGAVGTGAVGTGAVGTGAVGTGAVGTGAVGTGAVGTGAVVWVR